MQAAVVQTNHETGDSTVFGGTFTTGVAILATILISATSMGSFYR